MSYRYEEFALWCSDILESTGCAISLPQLTTYLERFVHDNVAYASENDVKPSDIEDADDQLTTSGKRKQQQQRGSRRRREGRERKKQITAPTIEVDSKEHHDGAGGEESVSRHHQMKLSSMFPVYGHLINLYDLKQNIGAVEVENLFSVLCYRPYHPTLPALSKSPPVRPLVMSCRVASHRVASRRVVSRRSNVVCN
jgi:hypothetical protein